MGFKKIAFTMTPATDIKRARAFYEDVLGLKLTESFGEEWIEFDLPGGGCLAVTTVAKDVKPSANSGSSVAFEVDDVKKTFADLKAKGVKVLLDLMDTPVCQMAILLDSEGNSFAIHQVKT